MSGLTEKANGSPDDQVFRSELIDLSEMDLADVSRLPNPVLRASLERLFRELASGESVFSGFRNTVSQDTGRETMPAHHSPENRADHQEADENGGRPAGRL